eukprot:5225275-Prymnesium_polylepis.1
MRCSPPRRHEMLAKPNACLAQALFASRPLWLQRTVRPAKGATSEPRAQRRVQLQVQLWSRTIALPARAGA